MRPLVSLLAVACAAFAIAPAASASSYDVVACGAAADAQNHSWIPSTNAPTFLALTSTCPPSGAYSGLAAYDRLATTNTPSEATATWEFRAPVATTVSGFRYSRFLGKDTDDDWQVFVGTAEGQVLDSCQIAPTDLSCSSGQPGYSALAERSIGGLATTGLTVGFSCRPTGGASTCGNGGTLHQVWAALYSATVTLSDSSSPSVSNVGGSLVGGGFVRGSRFVSFDASDNAGVRQGRVYVDGAVVASETYSCDFTYTVPCSSRSGSRIELDTRSVSDGSHLVQVAAVDPAGNEVRSPGQTIAVDNGAPDAPRALEVEGGGDWRADNSFAVSWMNPGGQGAPIAAAHCEICGIEAITCGPEQRVAAQNVSRIDGLSAPSTGEWAVHVWLEDAAGNVDPLRVATTTLRYGSRPRIAPDEPAAVPGGSSPVIVQPDALTEIPAPPRTTPGPLQPLPRRAPLLRLTSARLTQRGRLVIRGRTALGASARVSL